jgi:hypothetical protein
VLLRPFVYCDFRIKLLTVQTANSRLQIPASLDRMVWETTFLASPSHSTPNRLIQITLSARSRPGQSMTATKAAHGAAICLRNSD